MRVPSFILDRFSLGDPANQLILNTVFRQWRLVLTVVVTSLISALCEGITLAIIFLAVEVLSAPDQLQVISLPGFASVPLPFSGGALVVFLMCCAVFAQATQSVMRYGNKVSIAYLAARCKSRVTSIVHQQVMNLSFACSSKYKIGQLNNYAASAPLAVQVQIESASGLLVNVLISFVYVVALVKISAWLLIAAIVLAFLVLLFQRYLEPRIKYGATISTNVAQSIRVRMIEDFQALRLLHTFGQLDFAIDNFKSLTNSLEHSLRAQSRRIALLEPVVSLIPIFAIALIVSLSVILLGSSSAGVLPGLVTFVLALQRLNARIGGITNDMNAMANNSASLDLTNEILTSRDKSFRRRSGVALDTQIDSIVFRSVSLIYEGSDKPVLQNVSFEASIGQTIALVGPSGAGKSSIVDLLTGLYDPSQGQIMVNGRSLSDIQLSQWQRHLGVVSQDTFLFNDTIKANLTLGLDEIDYSAIVNASKLAQADGFIQALPAAYDTVVGERGYKLSGGQRQRISLARALLRSPDLLILDEATSALDTRSERLVQTAMQQIHDQCIVLVIAHRLSTIVNSDLILVLDRGRIIERGNHVQLLKNGGLYSKLWNQQSKFETC